VKEITNATLAIVEQDYLTVEPRMSSRLHLTQRLMESKAQDFLKMANGLDSAILRQFLMYRDKRNAGN